MSASTYNKKPFRNDKLVFVCVTCNTPVYRIGKKVSEVLKKCGKCNSGITPKYPKGTSIGVAEETTAKELVGELTSVQLDVKKTVEHYRAKLNKVLELSVNQSDVPFGELWSQAMRILQEEKEK